MKKFLVQFSISITLFLALFFILSRIDWMRLFQPHENNTEKEMGKWFWNVYSSNVSVLEDKEVLLPLDSILTHICEANGIDPSSIKLHVVREKEINAFACPGKQLVIYSSLIASCKNEMELCGVIAHELAHIEKKHVMKKLKKEIGLAMFFGMISGDGSKVIEVVKVLSTTAYDRSYETEADKLAVEYLLNAEVDPTYLAVFLDSISQDDPFGKLSEWINTHPDATQRNNTILSEIEHREKINQPKAILHKSTWSRLEKALSGS